MIPIFTKLEGALKGFGMSCKAAGVAAKALSGVAIGGIIIGISLLAKVIDTWHVTTDEALESLESSVSKFESATSEVKNLEDQLETCTQRLAELQKLADNGSISIADKKELELLKEQNEELERQLALKQAEQIEAQQDVLKDNKKLLNTKVRSSYDYTYNYNGSRTPNSVTAEKELDLAIAEYEKLRKDLLNEDLSDGARADIKDKMDYASQRISDMYDIISPSIDAYNELIAVGYKLEGQDKERYEQLKKSQDEYLLYNYNLNGTKMAFQGLNAEQQKNILLNRLVAQGLSDIQAEAVLNSVSRSDYDDLWDKDFSFIPPQMTDYSTAEEYGKAYAEAWLKGVQKKISKEEIDLLSITDTVDNLNTKLKPALDSLAGLYNNIFADGFNIENIDIEELASIKSELDSLKELKIDVPLKDYENFVTVLSNTTSEDEAHKAFDDLASSIINASGAVELTEENYNLLRKSLENLGVVNANNVLEEMKYIQDKLADSGINLTNVTLEEAEAFIASTQASDQARLYLQSYMLQKYHSNENPLNTLDDILALEKECSALKVTGEYYKQVLELKRLYQAAKHGSIGTELQDEIKTAKANLESLYDNQYKYSVDFDFDGSKNGSGSGSGTKSTKETFDWIEKLISRIQRNITNLGKVVSATYRNWSTRNNALAQEMGEVNKEISAQMTAYNAYMAKANSVPLAEGYKELVRSGAYKITDITDDKLKEQIQEYEEWYEKALNASDAIEDLRANLAELAMTKFNNISEQYDDQISMITHNVSMLEGFVSQSEAAGYMASEVYYEAMASKQQEDIAQLQGEYSSLLSAFDEAVKNGSIEKYSSDWYDMLSAINDVELELQDATTQLIEFNQTLQQLSWEAFDRVQGYVSNIVAESEHLINILDSYDLHNDNGAITSEGLAVQGLHAVNYNTYMEQSLAYAEELRRIEAEMANDPYDLELVDRRNELLGLQQDAISNAMAEKEAIKDLVADGYDKMLESLNNTITKRKEMLNDIKDMYDYQNTISEKTSNISSLRKQLQAYSGDNSESAKATIQKLQVSLAEAEKDLEQTEYDKYLSDQEQMLDQLADETEQWINMRLDNIDGLVAEAVDATNRNAETISNAIHEAAGAYGYQLSDQMETIWDYESNAIDGVVSVVSVYGDVLKGAGEALLTSNNNIANAITGGTTSVITAINNLNASMQNMKASLDNTANTNKQTIAQAQTNVTSGQSSSSYGGNNNTSNVTVSSSSNSSEDDKKLVTKNNKKHRAIVDGVEFGSGYKDANEAQSVVDAEIAKRAEAKAKQAREEAKKRGANGSPLEQIYNNTKSSETSRLKANSYAKYYSSGTSNAKRGLHIVSESEYGDELILDNHGNAILAHGTQLFPFEGGETVLNADETKGVLNNIMTPLDEQSFLGNMVRRPSYSNKYESNLVGGGVKNDIQMNIAVKANNYDEFVNSFKSAVKTDPQCRKLLQAVTVDELVGRGGLARNKF